MAVANVSIFILFVESPPASAAFYAKLLGCKPVEEHPTFVAFQLPNGTRLGLWSRHTARPNVEGTAGSSELCFLEDNVEEVYDQWLSLGIPMALAPCACDGLSCTFVALDPDGHRIRVYKE